VERREPNMAEGKPARRITAPAIQARKGGAKIKMVTAYDAPTAHIADRAGADIILVGDSVANVVLGHEDTLAVSIDVMVHHTAAVSRTKPRALVVGDMPWLSYHSSTQETVANAGSLIREGGASAVKLEGGRKRIPMIEAVLNAEIPVMGHLGLTPQSVNSMGGYRVQGKEAQAAYEMISDAHALVDAGVFSLVLEGVPDIVAQIVTKEVPVPTIGIGAGVHCDGQVLVFHDATGLGAGEYLPKFVRQYANLADDAVVALEAFFSDVEAGVFPSERETYHMSADSEEILRNLSSPGDHIMADEAMEA
jgi:3-methyl-2-oxobutanoate hydroxymethyltransferase